MGDESRAALSYADLSAQVFQLLAVGQKRRAHEITASFLARSPEEPGAHTLLSTVLLSLGQAEAALRAAEQAVRLDPERGGAHRLRARALFVLGRFQRAEDALRQALALDPEDRQSCLLYANLLETCGKPRPALDLVTRALELDPDDSDAHRLRARLLLETRCSDWNLPENAALAAVRLDPEDADAHAALGALRLHRSRVEEAEESFREALRLDPHQALARRGLEEAMMARHPAYRPFLRYSLWMQRSSQAARIAAVAGSWIVVSALAQALPADAGTALNLVWLSLCAYTWFAAPISRWLLSRQYPFLRESL